MKYYVDSCIYLNLWKREVGFDGTKYWELAKNFFNHLEKSRNIIYYSGFILKELEYKFKDEPGKFIEKSVIFSEPIYNKIKANESNYSCAREFEQQFNYEISFFDYMHITLAEKHSAALITRDNDLLKTAKFLGVNAKRPEELIH